MTSELTASALLVSAMIQTRTYGLSVYHANIILILSWINFVPTYFIGSIIDALDDAVHPTEGRRKFRWRVGWKGFLGQIIRWMHYIAVAGFRLWIWSDVKSFGDQPQCTPDLCGYLWTQHLCDESWAQNRCPHALQFYFIYVTS